MEAAAGRGCGAASEYERTTPEEGTALAHGMGELGKVLGWRLGNTHFEMNARPLGEGPDLKANAHVDEG